MTTSQAALRARRWGISLKWALSTLAAAAVQAERSFSWEVPLVQRCASELEGQQRLAAASRPLQQAQQLVAVQVLELLLQA